MHTRVWRIRVMTLLTICSISPRSIHIHTPSIDQPGYLSHDRYPEYSSHLDTDSDAA
jgi:hypothetical protein